MAGMALLTLKSLSSFPRSRTLMPLILPPSTQNSHLKYSTNPLLRPSRTLSVSPPRKKTRIIRFKRPPPPRNQNQNRPPYPTCLLTPQRIPTGLSRLTNPSTTRRDLDAGSTMTAMVAAAVAATEVVTVTVIAGGVGDMAETTVRHAATQTIPTVEAIVRVSTTRETRTIRGRMVVIALSATATVRSRITRGLTTTVAMLLGATTTKSTAMLATDFPAARGRRNQGGNDRSHDTPLHLRNGGGGGDQSYRLPSRTYEREDSFNTNTPVENENDNSGAPSGGDEWNPTHDGWATRDEPSPATAPREVPSEGQAVDSWGAPAHDPWVSTQTQTTRTATPARATPPSRLAPVPETDIYQASSREAAIANEWVAHHDPWAASLGADENSSNGQSQVQKPEPESNKYDSPSRGHGSALRDNKNGGHFVPSQSSVAALAASRATEMYDSAGSVDPHELPAEFNYFMHSETVDWTGTEPTKVTQNSFSPSQNLKTNTPTPPPVNAPQPRNTQSFDYDQQVSQDEYSGAGEGSFTLGKMKTEHYEPSQSDYKRVPPLQWGRGDENENRGGGYDRDRERGGDRDRRDYGDDRRGDERRGGDEWNDFEYGGGRRGGDDYDSGRGRRGDDYGRGRDDYDGRGGHRYDDDNRGGRRGDDYNTSGGRFDDNNGPPRNKYGGAGPLPGPYKGPPRTTSFGNPNFVPPSLNDY
ncbi:hypothetical protein FB45DRAFT_419456 [Roridomyces roridus]|uniref:Uncharacterized protein n=1 Tax=Roridomyces roridus TaxID=1738132 RepID=A0AAD7C526_9AGAR|nr:hypothetical protein FB45DRAFT_419456 [Roridomyces roridus]